MPSVDTRGRRPAAALAFALALLAYSGVALVATRWWISGLAAPVVAALLWWRHPRARFSAYVFFSVVGMRGLVTRSWPSLAFAAAAIALLQTPAARTAWPRLARRFPRRDGDTMSRP